MPDIQLFLDRIKAGMPGLEISKAVFNSDGYINDVVIVNDSLALRFPKNEQARQDLAHEIKILSLVRQFVDLPVPRFETYGGEFVSYPLIPGEALHQSYILQLDEAAQDFLAQQLATFLQQLHTIPASTLSEAGIQPANSERTREDWLRLYQATEAELFPLMMTHSREWIRNLFEPLLNGTLDLSYRPVLIHGDLGPYHILYDKGTNRLNGVIDFGTGGIGDCADDFANIINGLGERFLVRMSKYYPALLASLERARFHAGTLELQWALSGVRSKDLSWFTIHLGRARDVLA